jgi:hypothetical protein
VSGRQERNISPARLAANADSQLAARLERERDDGALDQLLVGEDRLERGERGERLGQLR